MTPPAVRPRSEEDAAGVGRFGVRSLLGLVALLVGALPFLVLMLLVRLEWTPVQDLDDRIAEGLNNEVSPQPAFVDVLQVATDLGSNVFAVYVFTLTTAWFLLRKQRRLAAYVATTGVGLAVLVPVTKALIGRARPIVPFPVAETPTNASFPSGHSMVAIVTLGMLALVLMPAVRRRWRPLLVIGALAGTVVVGFTRLALGVHFLSDVLAGWALGAGWLAVTTAVFSAWQRTHGVDTHAVTEGVDPEAVEGQQPVAPRVPVLPRGRRTLRPLGIAAAAIAAVLIPLGLLLTTALADTAIARWDERLVLALLDDRTAQTTDLIQAVSTLSGTPTVIGLSVAAGVLALAVTAQWRPAFFVAVAVLGEVLLYFVVSRIVGRERPDVPDLTSGLPVGASWPSGHVAAAVVVYGAIAALVVVLGRSRLRWAVVLLPVVIPPLVAVARLYVAAHHVTDVVAGLLLGYVWLAACIRWLLLDREEQWVPPAYDAEAEHRPSRTSAARR